MYNCLEHWTEVISATTRIFWMVEAISFGYFIKHLGSFRTSQTLNLISNISRLK